MRGKGFGRDPKFFLFFRQNPTRCNGVDPYPVAAKFTRHRSRQSGDAGVRRCIAGITSVAHHIADRGKIDDRAPAIGLHAFNYRLAGKEICLEIDRLGLIPKGFGDLLGAVAHIIGRVVDQNSHCPMGCGSLCDGGLQGAGIGDVAGDIQRSLTVSFIHLVAKVSGIRTLDKGDAGALLQKTFSERGTDARAPPGNEDAGVFEVLKRSCGCHVAGTFRMRAGAAWGVSEQ